MENSKLARHAFGVSSLLAMLSIVGLLSMHGFEGAVVEIESHAPQSVHAHGAAAADHAAQHTCVFVMAMAALAVAIHGVPPSMRRRTTRVVREASLREHGPRTGRRRLLRLSVIRV